ncbi:MAG: prolyl oligopeptidase family serine peptidase [Flavisolibacter sp.]
MLYLILDMPFRMRHFFFLPVLVLVLVACRKETVGAVAPLPAQNLFNLSYGPDSSQTMDLYLPAGRSMDSTKLLICIHGGAWVSGDKTDFAGFVPDIQQRLPHYAIANLNYHLATATAYHFPTQENDLRAAMGFFQQYARSYGLSQNFVLLGASAGGQMALLQGYKYPDPRIKAVVDFYGPVDLGGMYNSLTIPFYKTVMEMLMNGTPSTNPSLYQQSSPLYFVSPQVPPTIIFHGDSDQLVPVSQSMTLDQALQQAGVPHQLVIYPGRGHELWPDAVMRDAFDKATRFLTNHVR